MKLCIRIEITKPVGKKNCNSFRTWISEQQPILKPMYSYYHITLNNKNFICKKSCFYCIL